MKRIMVLSGCDFVKDANRQITPTLSNLKDDVRKKENNYDIIAYLEKDKVILFKNRFRPLTSFELSSGLADLFPVQVDAGRYTLKTIRN